MQPLNFFRGQVTLEKPSSGLGLILGALAFAMLVASCGGSSGEAAGQAAARATPVIEVVSPESPTALRDEPLVQVPSQALPSVSISTTTRPIITSVTSPVSPGNTAKVNVLVVSGAICSIVYKAPNGSPVLAEALGDKTADPGGSVTWSWTIGAAARLGTGMVRVTCGGLTAQDAIVIR